MNPPNPTDHMDELIPSDITDNTAILYKPGIGCIIGKPRRDVWLLRPLYGNMLYKFIHTVNQQRRQ